MALECSSGWFAGCYPSDTAFQNKHQSLPVEVASSCQWSLGQWFYAGAPFTRDLRLDLGKHFPFVSKISRSGVIPSPTACHQQPIALDFSTLCPAMVSCAVPLLVCKTRLSLLPLTLLFQEGGAFLCGGVRQRQQSISKGFVQG